MEWYPFNAADPLYVAVESGAWLVNAYPICEKFPCTREEFKGSWEDRFNFDYVSKIYEKLKLQGALASFYQELMLQILSDDTRLISETDVKWYYKKPIREKRLTLISILQLTLLPVKSSLVIIVLSVYGQLTIKDLSIGLMVSVSVKQWIRILMIYLSLCSYITPICRY